VGYKSGLAAFGTLVSLPGIVLVGISGDRLRWQGAHPGVGHTERSALPH
jgi:hypothetical protein